MADRSLRVVLASNNAGKIREFKTLLQDFHFELVSQADLGVEEVEETGLSFIENALIKARHAARITGLPAIADDSGLVVDALNGAPGIYSSRFAGQQANAFDNIKKLLFELKNVPNEKRTASFHCVLAFMQHATDPTPLVCDGKWSGLILHAPQGKEGHGYDPIFYLPTEKKSAAELSLEMKNNISHRGKATQSLLSLLPEKLNELNK